MWKMSLLTVAVSASMLLAGCTMKNNDDINEETPMEDVKDGSNVNDNNANQDNINDGVILDNNGVNDEVDNNGVNDKIDNPNVQDDNNLPGTGENTDDYPNTNGNTVEKDVIDNNDTEDLIKNEDNLQNRKNQ